MLISEMEIQLFNDQLQTGQKRLNFKENTTMLYSMHFFNYGSTNKDREHALVLPPAALLVVPSCTAYSRSCKKVNTVK